MTLERQVDQSPPTAGATAGRMALSCVVGATAVAIAFVARPQAAPPPPPAPTPAAPPHITVTVPPPIVVSMETVVQSPVTLAVPWEMTLRPVSSRACELTCTIGAEFPSPLLGALARANGARFFLRRHLATEGPAFARDIEQKFAT